jgi:hypothetical protein
MLANALELVMPSNKNDVDLYTPFWRLMTECLVLNLKQAAHRPQEAAWSARCIRFLPVHKLIASHSGPEWDEATLQRALRRAHEYGKAHHFSLEQESHKVMVETFGGRKNSIHSSH